MPTKLTPEESLRKLRQRLLDMPEWPQKYMFKFIAPNHDNLVNRVVEMLPPGGQKSFKPSNDLHYVGVTYVIEMPSADAVIDLTQRVTSQLEGVISL